MMRKSTTMMALTAGLMALSACTSTGKDKVADAAPPPEPPPSMEPSCGAEQYSAYVGQPASDEVIGAITQSRGDKAMRVVRPGQPVTMDYRPDRLNVQIGDDGKIKGFACS